MEKRKITVYHLKTNKTPETQPQAQDSGRNAAPAAATVAMGTVHQ